MNDGNTMFFGKMGVFLDIEKIFFLKLLILNRFENHLGGFLYSLTGAIGHIRHLKLAMSKLIFVFGHREVSHFIYVQNE